MNTNCDFIFVFVLNSKSVNSQTKHVVLYIYWQFSANFSFQRQLFYCTKYKYITTLDVLFLSSGTENIQKLFVKISFFDYCFSWEIIFYSSDTPSLMLLLKLTWPVNIDAQPGVSRVIMPPLNFRNSMNFWINFIKNFRFPQDSRNSPPLPNQF